MRQSHGRGARNQKGLDAALKRLWPNGDGPVQGSGAQSQAREARGAPDPADAPTLPFLAERQLPGVPRNTCTLVSIIGALVAACLLTATEAPRAREDADPGWSIPPLENLTVRGAIRILDEQGNVVALLGNLPGEQGQTGSMGLELRSPGSAEPNGTLRLESLASGATLSLRTPDRRSSATLVSGEAGPYLLMAQGTHQRLIGTESGEALPAVGTGAGSEARELDLLDGRAQSLGEGLSAVGLRMSHGKLRGRLLNTSSVRHTDVEVQLAVADQRLKLAVPVISPGNSTGFAVAAPEGVPDAMLRSARIERVSSTLHYDAHQPGSESAQVR